MSRATRISTVARLFALIACLSLAVTAWGQNNTSTSVATNPTPSSVLGQSVMLTATVTDTGGVSPVGTDFITGTVLFLDSGVVIGSASTTGTKPTATAAFTTSLLARGAHAAITALYLGDANFNPSTPNTAASTLTVGPRSTSTAVAALTPVTVRSTAPVPVTVTDTVNGGSAGTFAANSDTTPNLVTGRSGHTATLLPDGTVLVVGGTPDNSATVFADGSPEIYTPGTGFAALAQTFTARTGAAATLLRDGTVLIVGGSSDGTAAFALASGEIYDPVAGTVTATTNSLNTARLNPTATLLANGNVVIAGGQGTVGTALASAEVFVPGATPATTGTFTAVTGNMSTARSGHTATLLNWRDAGAILMAGGIGTTSAELYTVTGTTGASAATGSLNSARSFHSATRLPDGVVLISGGFGAVAVNTSELYDPSTGTGTFVLVGGADWAATTAFAYGTIITPTTHNAGGYAFKCTTAGTSGGTVPASFNQTPGNTTTDGGAVWTNIGVRNLTTARAAHTATLLDTGQVLLAGGLDATPATLGSAELYTPSYDPQGTVTPASDNGGAGTADTVVNCTLTLNGIGATSCNASVTPNHVNATTAHKITASYADAGVPNHSGSTDATGQTLTVNRQALTLTALTHTKTYDGTTSDSLTPNLTGTLLNNASAHTDVATLTQTFDSRNASTVGGRTLTPAVVIKDFDTSSDVTADYTITPVTAAGTINTLALTVTAVTNTKTYDGTTSAAGIPTFAPPLGTGDTAAFTEAYSDRKAGVGNKTLIPSGSVNDGNGGANYTYTYVNFTTGTINPLALTVTAVTNTKTYDGNTSAAGIPTFAPPLGTGDTAAFTEAYSDRKAGVGNKTLIPSGTVNDGNGGANYTYTYVNFTTGTINQLALTVTAVTNTKTYDGITSAAGVPTFAPPLIAPDTPNFTETYSNRNAGVGNKTLIPSGTVNDGNGGANYTYTYVNFTTGTINQLALTVTAVTNTKTYDGTTSAAGVPTFAPPLGTGDAAAFTEAYSDRKAGVGNKTLIPSGTVNDGNGGANYTYTYVNFTTGTINQLALTVTAVTNTKTYDGNTSAAGVPTFAPPLGTGDTAAFTEAYSDGNAGVGNKTLIPSGTVNDGNGGANYTYTYVNFTTGTINALAITPTLTAANKTYDGTNTEPNGSMSCSLTGVLAGDSANVACTPSSGTFDGSNVGAHTVTATVTISGTASGNYTLGAAGTAILSTTATATASITSGAITATLTAANKVYDTTNIEPNANMSCALSGVLLADTGNVICTATSGTFASANAGSQTVMATVTISGTAAGNYTLGAAGTTTPSTAATATATIGPAATSMSQTSNSTVANIASGGTFTFTVTVAAVGVPTGTVAFTDNGAALGSPAMLIGGTATLSSVALTTSNTVPHSIVATYTSDTLNYVSSTSTLNITVATLAPFAAGRRAVRRRLLYPLPIQEAARCPLQTCSAPSNPRW